MPLETWACGKGDDGEFKYRGHATVNFGGGGPGSVCILFITAPLHSGYTPESQEVQPREKLEKEGTLSGTYAPLHPLF